MLQYINVFVYAMNASEGDALTVVALKIVANTNLMKTFENNERQ